MSLLVARASVLLIGLLCLLTFQADGQTDGPRFDFGDAIPKSFSENPLPLDDQARIVALQSLDVSEWLGPMAPVALSPFFGITCLAGLSQFGGDWLPANSFLSTNPVLNNPAVFWTFAVLTLLTSLPRLTKVSKPAAQALDFVETYAAIITIIVIRVFATSNQPEPEFAAAAPVIVQMGIFSFTADMLLSVAAIINILVINSVKFFCEMMIWLTPFPFIDALLELANKSLCAALMAIYAYSPTIATMLNLALFIACLIVFRWTSRQVGYLRSLLIDPLRAYLQPAWAVPGVATLDVFPQNAWGPFPAKARLQLVPTEKGWTVTQRRFLLPDNSMELAREIWRLEMKSGMLLNYVIVECDGDDPQSVRLLFSRRYSGDLPGLAGLMVVRLVEDAEPQTVIV